MTRQQGEWAVTVSVTAPLDHYQHAELVRLVTRAAEEWGLEATVTTSTPDPPTGSVYVEVHGSVLPHSHTDEVARGVLVDFDQAGNVRGVEVLGASAVAVDNGMVWERGEKALTDVEYYRTLLLRAAQRHPRGNCVRELADKLVSLEGTQ